jgi:hypothetical protein
VAELREPGGMFLRPQRPALSVIEAVGAKDAKNATLGGFGVFLVGIPKTKELAQSFLIFSGNVNRCKMAASVETREILGVETVSLTALTRLSRDERRGDDLAVEPVSGKHPMKDKPCPGCFITGLQWPLLSEAPEETTDLHEIPGKPNDFRNVRIPVEDRGRDRIEMHVETDPGILRHGWTPPKKSLSVSITHVALAQVQIRNTQANPR